MSLIFTFDNACLNCSNVDKVWKLAVSYRCSECNFINCLMCNKIHDNACDIFYKAHKDFSILSTSTIKSTESSNLFNNATQKKKSVNIQDLDLGKKLLCISNSEDSGSTPKKPRMMKRRYTIAADAILNREKVDKVISDYKCNTCETFYKTKATLSRHMKSIRHLNNSKNLKDKVPEVRIKIDHVSSAETIFNDFEA